METPAAVTQATAKPFYNIFPSFMHAHKTITSINIDEEDVASSTLRDDGCGCCMSDIKQHKVQTLEKAIEDMEEIVEQSKKVLEARKEKFEEVGSSLSNQTKEEYHPACRSCGKEMSNVFRNRFFLVKEEILCKSCVDEEDGLFRDRGTVYRRVE